MNKILFLILGFFLMCFSAQSQTKWSVGVAATNNLSALSGDQITKKDYGYGIRFSVFRKITKRLYFSSGVYYTTRKYHDSVSINDTFQQLYKKGRLVMSGSYYGVPLLLNFRFPLSQKFSLTLTTGITLEWTKYLETTIYWENEPPKTHSGGFIAMRPRKIQSVYLGVGLGGIYKLNDRFSLMGTTFSMFDFNFGNLDNLISNELIIGVLYNFNLGLKKSPNEYFSK